MGHLISQKTGHYIGGDERSHPGCLGERCLYPACAQSREEPTHILFLASLGRVERATEALKEAARFYVYKASRDGGGGGAMELSESAHELVRAEKERRDTHDAHLTFLGVLR